MEIHKVEYLIPAPHPEVLAESRQIWEAWERTLNATPEERTQWAEQRAAQRAAAERVPLTMDALLDNLGFSREYAEHLVQPYCLCGDSDGWNLCQHAIDEGYGR